MKYLRILFFIAVCIFGSDSNPAAYCNYGKSLIGTRIRNWTRRELQPLVVHQLPSPLSAKREFSTQLDPNVIKQMSDLALSLAHVWTQGESSYDYSYFPSFRSGWMNTHWVKRFIKESPTSINQSNNPADMHKSFQHQLSERVRDNIGKKLISTNHSHSLPSLSINAGIASAGNNYSFINGHLLDIEMTSTKFSKIFVACYDKNIKNKKVKWLMPIEQAFLCRTLGDYLNSAALLKFWDVYSGFLLVVIPEGASVHLRTGLVHPQSTPDILSYFTNNKVMTNIQTHKDFLSFYDVDKQRTLSDLNLAKDKEPLLYELTYGGMTQFFVLSINKYHIVEIDALELPTAFNRAIPIPGSGQKYWPGRPDKSHLLPQNSNNYGEVRLDFIGGLEKLKLLTPKECKEISFVLDKLHEPKTTSVP